MSPEGHEHQARRIAIVGRVQGVGYRPFVTRLAAAMGLDGWVLNDSNGVAIHVQGPTDRLDHFVDRLRSETPPAAVVLGFTVEPAELAGEPGFRIVESRLAGDEPKPAPVKQLVIAPDLIICPACLAETRDPADRRFGYALNSCTDCGPRFTIQESIPFDRARTTMADFPLCADCQHEYESPTNRRFHAQNIGCPQCGPRLWLEDGQGNLLVGPDAANDEPALERAAELLRDGGVIAAKGIGGFHLHVLATSSQAVERLRQRKRRDRKPFAVLFADCAAAAEHLQMWGQRSAMLSSVANSIVLLKRKPESTLAPEVAPGLPSVGALLPATALQARLLEKVGQPLIATSGNLTDEPIPIENAAARRDLAGLADAFLMHNRRILRQADDSVVRPIGADDDSVVQSIREYPVPIRTGRGQAPLRIEVDRDLPPMLALGGHMKAAVAVSRGRELFLGPHLGDLDTLTARKRFRESAADLCKLLAVKPERVLHDAHPDYDSTRFAHELKLPRTAVSHHIAHIYSCLAEHNEQGPALGVAFDGTGLGPDGTIWGGEFLSVMPQGWWRFGSLWPFMLPGGDKAAREPRRSAIGVCDAANAPWPADDGFTDDDRELLKAALGSPTLSRMTTSAGRLFDAWAALLGCAHVSAYESEAAMRFEALADAWELPDPGFKSRPVDDHGIYRVDWRPWVLETQDVLSLRGKEGYPEGLKPKMRTSRARQLAERFHVGLAWAIGEMAVKMLGAPQASSPSVVCSGGCFLNQRLTKETCRLLGGAGFRVLTHRRVPPGDGGLALGQLWAVGLDGHRVLSRDGSGDKPVAD